MTVSQYDHVVPYTDLGGRGYFGVNAALVGLAFGRVMIELYFFFEIALFRLIDISSAVESLIYKTQNLQCFSSCLAVVWAQSIEARC